MIDLDAIEGRLAAATPGPWYLDESLRGVEATTDGFPVEVVTWTTHADAVLIAHAPGDIAALVEEVGRLRAVESDAERARVKADLWSYYEAFVLANGAEGITQLVVQRDEARAEVERLRSINDDYLLEMGRQHALLRGQRHADNEAIAGAWDAGRDNERAAGVAWLREWQNTMDDRITHDDLDYAIAVIERGEHRREETK